MLKGSLHYMNELQRTASAKDFSVHHVSGRGTFSALNASLFSYNGDVCGAAHP